MWLNKLEVVDRALGFLSHRTMERAEDKRRLAWALGITTVYFVAEVIGAILTNSLALLSDAGHMLSDMAALALSLFAFHFAGRPATVKRTFGYHRLEIVAALINGLTLWLIVGIIFHEAYQRFVDPPAVRGLGMLVVATLGLVVNIIAGVILYRSHHENLNVRGAFLHIIGDALGSVGAIIAGAIILSTGWYVADPVVSVFIGLLILYTSWTLIKESVDILMQAVPKGIKLEDVQKAMEGIDGVTKVHDLHLWAVTSGILTLSAHVVINGREDMPQLLNEIEGVLREYFNIEHTTIQLETEDREANEFQAF